MAAESPLLAGSDPSAPTRELVEYVEGRAQWAREETVRLVSIAKTGHYASSFSCAEILASLYYGGILRLRAGEPDWPDRDRFVFGKGHAAAAFYPMLVEWGFLDKRVLDQYTRLGNPLGDHPDSRRVPGVDFSSGSLGHALSAAVGMALAARINGRSYRVYALLGDGELNEGQVWEAALSGAHHRLDAITAIVDRNEYSLDGRVEDVMGIEPVAEKWRAFRWEVEEVDGHDVASLLPALMRRSDRPRCIIAHTVKGKGVRFMEGHIGWHLGYLAPSDEARVLKELRGPVGAA
jgi:transketolase